MVLVYFRGYGDWLTDDNDGRPVHLIKTEDRSTYIESSFFVGYRFYRPCDLVEGVFRLTDSDERLYKIAGSLSNIKISQLLPCRHYDSAFTKMVDKGLLNIDVLDHCYFKIVTNRYNNARLRRRPELAREGKFDYDLILYKTITDETESIYGLITESVFNSSPIRARNPIIRQTESLEILHDALDEIEKETGKTPCAVDLANYILSPSFKHRNIKESSGREIRLSSGKIVTKKNIESIYRGTIFKKRQINTE